MKYCSLLTSIICLHLSASTINQHMYQEAERRTQKLFGMLRAAANNSYIGEEVSQLQHALQCAYQAMLAGGSNEQIIAALFHDIGHQLPGEDMDGWGTKDHENLGADFLKEHGFSPAVYEVVRAHIHAKHYFVCVDPTYFNQLSWGSQNSYRYQGDRMTKEQAAAFEKDPLFEQKIALRRCEELAKDPDAIVPELDTYYQMVVDHLYEQLLKVTS